MAEQNATTEILGRPVRGFRAEFNQAVADQMTAANVSARATDLAGQLGRRSGAVDLGHVDMGNTAAMVQARADLQFGSQSSAVYHANKHGGELPAAHQAAAFGPDEVSPYIRSVNETATPR